MGIPRDLDPEFIGPSWVVGSPLGLPAVLHGILCYCFEGTSVCGSVCVWEAPSFGVSGTWCLAVFRLLRDWPFPRNLSLAQLRSPALPPLYMKKKNNVFVCAFVFRKDSHLCLVCRNGNGSSSLSLACVLGVSYSTRIF